MAVQGSRMRLTVVVESLAEENAHGEYRELALEAFKERKFAMPVKLEDTFETVWNEIEQRYKTNYLDAQQAATFSIKKLQDAYDCDLDMTDTVGAIFEGEPDRKMHMIKVVPHFIYRETSVVPGSKLRPSGAQKRLGDDIDEGANKRQRVELQQPQDVQEARNSSPNRPIASTESQHVAAQRAEHQETDGRVARSRSGMSLIELDRIETGQAPFSSTGVKQESPGPEQSLGLNGINTESPEEPAKRPVHVAPGRQSQNLQRSASRSNSWHKQDSQAKQPTENEVNGEIEEAEEESARSISTSSGYTQARPEDVASLEFDSQEVAIHKSPVSSVEAEPAPAPAIGKRRDVYQVPSSPEFMHKKATPEKHAKTYGRSPRPAQVIRKEVDLLNLARHLSRSTKEMDTSQGGPSTSTSNKAHVFQRPQPDEIESTPQKKTSSALEEGSHATSDDDNGDTDLTASFLNEAAEDGLKSTQTPAEKTSVKSVKSGSLKKPSRVSLPASTQRGAKSKVATTPTSGTLANKSGAKGVTKTTSTTPSSGGTSKSAKALSHETTSRMEHLQKLLNASQNTPKHRADTSSPVRNGYIENRDNNNRSPTEVRKPGQRKAESVDLTGKMVNAQPTFQPPTMQKTPMKSPVPLPSNTLKPTPASSTSLDIAVETPKVDAFRIPAAKIRESPVPLPLVKRSSNATATSTPRRSEIPLPPNVRNLRRSSSLQSSPLANGDCNNGKSSPAVPATTPAKSRKSTPSATKTCTEPPVAKLDVASEASKAADLPPTAKLTHSADAIVISSAESSSSDDSDLENEQQRDSKRGVIDKTTKGVSTSTDIRVPMEEATQHAVNNADMDMAAKEGTEQPNDLANTHIDPPQTQDKPPSGQGSNEAASWVIESTGLGGKDQIKNIGDKPGQAPEPESRTGAPVAPTSDDEGFAEPEIYNTAAEDNISRSSSPSAAASIRSSPAVSRRPARFLSHSPTPDVSESEDDSDEISVGHSRAASPHANDKEESQSESESSSDSSEDEDVEMPDLLAESTTDSHTNAAPPSSPPFHTITNSTPVVLQTSQSTPSQTSHPPQRTPVRPPTQQSSQAPRSSQSASVQTADRRRYTGFRSLREQLADTKAAQATTQTNIFDPRTMSLGKLAKGKPLMSFGHDNESSEDESSSSSSSDSD